MSTSNSQPTPLPKYIYKILPSSPAPPSPLPVALPLSPLDARDKFIHLSTSTQLPLTLLRFFSNVSSVLIARIPYTPSLATFIRWENATGGAPPSSSSSETWDTKTATGRSFFPHIYANDDKEGEKGLRLRLGSGEIERIGEWFRSPDGGWRVEDWPFGDEDRPSAL